MSTNCVLAQENASVVGRLAAHLGAACETGTCVCRRGAAAERCGGEFPEPVVGCDAGEHCEHLGRSHGVCCTQSLVRCSAFPGTVGCFDVQTDRLHCGACFHACAPDQVCQVSESMVVAPDSPPNSETRSGPNGSATRHSPCPFDTQCCTGTCFLACLYDYQWRNPDLACAYG